MELPFFSPCPRVCFRALCVCSLSRIWSPMVVQWLSPIYFVHRIPIFLPAMAFSTFLFPSALFVSDSCAFFSLSASWMCVSSCRVIVNRMWMLVFCLLYPNDLHWFTHASTRSLFFKLNSVSFHPVISICLHFHRLVLWLLFFLCSVRELVCECAMEVYFKRLAQQHRWNRRLHVSQLSPRRHFSEIFITRSRA